MNFGAELDDDLFETTEHKQTKEPIEYAPKIYSNEWFLQPDCNQEEEYSTQLKTNADYLYYHHEYTDCVKKYLECLDILQSSNITVKRDCLEGIARSLLHQEHFLEAVNYALELLNVGCNIDHKVVAWSLLASIFHQMCRYSDELDALHNCLQHHSWNYDFWLRLAFCYSGLFGIELNNEIKCKLLNVPTNTEKQNLHMKCKDCITPLDSKTKKTLSRHIVCAENNTRLYPHLNEKSCDCFCYKLHADEMNCDKISLGKHCSCSIVDKVSQQHRNLIICACLVRARLLLQTCILGYRSFAQKSIVWQQEQISLLLKPLDVSKNVVEKCTQVYLSDIGNGMVDLGEDKSVLEKLKEKSLAEEKEIATGNFARKQFETRWFGWLLTR